MARKLTSHNLTKPKPKQVINLDNGGLSADGKKTSIRRKIQGGHLARASQGLKSANTVNIMINCFCYMILSSLVNIGFDTVEKKTILTIFLISPPPTRSQQPSLLSTPSTTPIIIIIIILVYQQYLVISNKYKFRLFTSSTTKF